MQRPEPPLITLAICLAALAGFVDALAFSSLGGFFVAFMSGNSTRLGAGLGSGTTGDAMVAGSLALSFVSGVILATVIVRATPGAYRHRVMAAVAALLAGGALVSEVRGGALPLLPVAAAMGAAHVMLRRQEGAAAGATHFTETLVRMGERIADAMMGDPDRLGWLPHLLLWFGFVAGAVLGAGSFVPLGLRALWIAAVAAAVVALWFLRRQKSAVHRHYT